MLKLRDSKTGEFLGKDGKFYPKSEWKKHKTFKSAQDAKKEKTKELEIY